MRTTDRVVVVIPARDEGELVATAIRAVRVAALAVQPRVRTTIVVVANACTDDTAQIARDCGATVLEVDIADVGAARAAGFAWALTQGLGPMPGLWFATTDADSRVPAGWLAAQLAAWRGGGDVYLGTVALAAGERASFAAWADGYDAAAAQGDAGHGHVHGASLGVRAQTYLRVGGFRSMEADEDVDLVIRLTAIGARVVWDESSPVTTSSRLVARAPRGVAVDLALSLDADDLPA
ncbi:MAG: putative glycosyl transferase family 2 [Aeromicrobium sp.]|nr:putative glycosyl transferase family 2 [Aeromicrobium sp.]